MMWKSVLAYAILQIQKCPGNWKARSLMSKAGEKFGKCNHHCPELSETDLY